MRCLGYLLLMMLGGVLAAAADEPDTFRAADLSNTLAPAALAQELAGKRVVFVGETHARFSDHLHQLELIEQLYALDSDLAIGVEYFSRRSQSQLDDYIAGRATEQAFLRVYYAQWGYDYRLYAPIFRFAREHRIPIRALNVPRALPTAVAKVGLDGLPPEQRAELPKDIEPAGDAYQARLRESFDAHDASHQRDFDRFVEAQLVWDEGMAESAAEYLDANPGRRMVVLAGSGHLAFGDGIPQRLQRRTGASYSIVLSSELEIEPGIADYILLSEDVTLPPPGVLGVDMEDADTGSRIVSFAPASAAEKSRLERGDVLIAIDGERVANVAEVRATLWDKKPGERVVVDVRRRERRRNKDLSFDVVLAAPHGSAAPP
jgi:uncharacterized iron-regulated protein